MIDNEFKKFKIRYIIIDFIVISITLGFIVGFLSAISPWITNENIELYLENKSNILGVIVIILWSFLIYRRLKYCDIKVKHIIGETNLKTIPWLLLLIIFYGEENLSVGIIYLEIFFTNLISPNLVISSLQQNQEMYAFTSQVLWKQIAYYCWIILATVVIVPVLEEFIFRGLILHRWAVKWGILWSVILSSLIFGLAHGDIFFLSRAVGSGFIALFYLQTKMLIVPIILHSMHNGLVLINHLFSNYDPNNIKITFRYLWLGLINTILSLPVLFYFLTIPQSLHSLPYFFNQENSKKN